MMIEFFRKRKVSIKWVIGISITIILTILGWKITFYINEKTLYENRINLSILNRPHLELIDTPHVKVVHYWIKNDTNNVFFKYLNKTSPPINYQYKYNGMNYYFHDPTQPLHKTNFFIFSGLSYRFKVKNIGKTSAFIRYEFLGDYYKKENILTDVILTKDLNEHTYMDDTPQDSLNLFFENYEIKPDSVYEFNLPEIWIRFVTEKEEFITHNLILYEDDFNNLYEFYAWFYYKIGKTDYLVPQYKDYDEKFLKMDSLVQFNTGVTTKSIFNFINKASADTLRFSEEQKKIIYAKILLSEPKSLLYYYKF